MSLQCAEPFDWARIGLSTLASLATTAPWRLKPSSGFFVIWMTYALTISPSKYIGEVGGSHVLFALYGHLGNILRCI